MSNRLWALLFGAVLTACFLSLALAPMYNFWLPRNVCVYGGDIDHLFYVILVATGVFFVLTEVILVVAIWRYGQHDPARRSRYTEGNNRLEMFWTVVPGIILLYITFAQIPAWSKITYPQERPEADQVVTVLGRQWEWRLRYTEGEPPSNTRAWADNPAVSDLHVVNELHTWQGARCTIYLKTEDVLHSFYLPNFRRKQDLLPGKTVPIWIEATEHNTLYDAQSQTWKLDPEKGPAWEIACAELCGGRHYAMRGLVFVHPDKADYDRWRQQQLTRQRSYSPDLSPVAKQ